MFRTGDERKRREKSVRISKSSHNRMSKESDHQQSTRMLLDNSLKQMHLAALARDEFVDREIKELHGQVNRRLQEVERVEARLKSLKEDNLALKSKIAEMEP